MKTKLYRNIILTFAVGLVAASCNSDQIPQPPPNVSILEGAKVPSQLTITPQATDKKSLKRMMFTSFVLTINTRTSQLQSLRMNEKAGNYTEYTFSNFQFK